MAKHQLVRYFAQGRGKFGVYSDEEWCLNKKTHIFRRAVYLPFGGAWQTLAMHKIGSCDGEKCNHFSTSNGKETLTEPIDPECIVHYEDHNLPPEFREFV